MRERERNREETEKKRGGRESKKNKKTKRGKACLVIINSHHPAVYYYYSYYHLLLLCAIMGYVCVCSVCAQTRNTYQVGTEVHTHHIEPSRCYRRSGKTPRCVPSRVDIISVFSPADKFVWNTPVAGDNYNIPRICIEKKLTRVQQSL